MKQHNTVKHHSSIVIKRLRQDNETAHEKVVIGLKVKLSNRPSLLDTVMYNQYGGCSDWSIEHYTNLNLSVSR